jgi:hypothetical protein
MNVLDSKILGSVGPNIEFAALPSMILCDEAFWPEPNKFRPYSFFSMPVFFVEAVCDVTNTWWFFDTYKFLQYNTLERIHGFSAELISLSGKVAAARISGFDRAMYLYDTSLLPEEMRNVQNLKCDMVHTLLHLGGLVNRVAQEQKCLAIVGV